MIEDLEGATSEPSRHRHVAALSAATAAFAIVLFYVLVAPPTFDGASPQAASPSPTRSFSMTVVSNPLLNLPPGMTRSAMCGDGATWAPLQLAVSANGGPAVSTVYDRTGSRPIGFVREERGTGPLVLTCATLDSWAPRIDRAR